MKNFISLKTNKWNAIPINGPEIYILTVNIRTQDLRGIVPTPLPSSGPLTKEYAFQPGQHTLRKYRARGRGHRSEKQTVLTPLFFSSLQFDDIWVPMLKVGRTTEDYYFFLVYHHFLISLCAVFGSSPRIYANASNHVVVLARV
jgi:hypothetical protein